MPETSDRRTLYTRAVIKDAFLALIASGGWRRLSVTLLCKKAGIARATFYLHYANLDEVLDDVLRDAFQVGDGDIRRVLRQLRQTMKAGTLTADAFLPLCQRAADSPRYRPLLLDEDLPGRILSFLYDTARADIVPLLMESASLTQQEADLLFRFGLQGSFAVNAALRWEKNETWYSMQDLILRFKMGGLEALQKRK